MKVAELIATLRALPPDAEILICQPVGHDFPWAVTAAVYHDTRDGKCYLAGEAR